MPDADLIELGKREVDRIGLASYADIEDGCVFRVPKSYPVYDSDYREYLAIVREFVDGLENFQTIGRNGLHRYNNQDHAMLTGMLAVRNLVLGEKHDLWSVNTDQEYHEEVRVEARVAAHDVAEVVQEALTRVFLKLDRLAFGLSLGSAAGAAPVLGDPLARAERGERRRPELATAQPILPWLSGDCGGEPVGLGYGFTRRLRRWLGICVSQERRHVPVHGGHPSPRRTPTPAETP